MEKTLSARSRGSESLGLGLTLLSALGRLLPHVPNVTPLGGSCLFAGSRVSGLWAYLLPLIVMVATDPLVGGYTPESPLIYASFLISVWIGRRMLNRVTPGRVGLAAFLSSLQFFALTNLAVWTSGVMRHDPFYAPGFSGLVGSYILAAPFWGRTLAGDLIWSAIIFGVYELVNRRIERSHAPAIA
jgi:hypothetical protein